MKHLHLLLTAPLETGQLPDLVREDMICDLYTLDRQDGPQKHELFVEKMNPLVEEAKKKNMQPYEFYAMARACLMEVCSQDTEIDLNPQLKGELRSYGTRRIGDGESETVIASHTCDYSTASEQFGMGLGVFPYPPSAYYGLSIGLSEVYERLCNKYDSIIQQVEGEGLDKRLLAESFFQIVGTRVLHPFWDANGRTFAAHLALTLERAQVQLRDYSTIESVISGLTPINERFFKEVLNDANLPIISQRQHHFIKLSHFMRQDYMQRLRAAIEKAIDQGTDDGSYLTYISDAQWTVKKVLIRSDLIKPSQYNEGCLRQEREIYERREREYQKRHEEFLQRQEATAQEEAAQEEDRANSWHRKILRLLPIIGSRFS